MNNVMLDLETLDTRSTGIILSIGAVKFSTNPQVIEGESVLGESFYVEFTKDLDRQSNLGRTISDDTVLWWAKQSKEARKVFNGGCAKPLGEALHDFSVYLSDTDYFVWGNGATFDNVMLRNLYENVCMPAPWDSYNDRCYRTLKNLPTELPYEGEEFGTLHNALDDACRQAIHAAKILREIYNAPAAV